MIIANKAISIPLEYLKIIHKRGGILINPNCSLQNACIMSASRGDIDCLIYCHNNGCDIDYYCYLEAARSGNLECFKYIQDRLFFNTSNMRNLCEDITYKAFIYNHMECYIYAIINGCPYRSIDDINTIVKVINFYDNKQRLFFCDLVEKYPSKVSFDIIDQYNSFKKLLKEKVHLCLCDFLYEDLLEHILYVYI